MATLHQLTSAKGQDGSRPDRHVTRFVLILDQIFLSSGGTRSMLKSCLELPNWESQSGRQLFKRHLSGWLSEAARTSFKTHWRLVTGDWFLYKVLASNLELMNGICLQWQTPAQAGPADRCWMVS